MVRHGPYYSSYIKDHVDKLEYDPHLYASDTLLDVFKKSPFSIKNKVKISIIYSQLEHGL